MRKVIVFILATLLVPGFVWAGGKLNPGLDDLKWCPPKRSKNPHPSGRLRIASWNLGNLHSKSGESVYAGSRPSEIRKSIDYERIKCYVRMFDPDILAVQEVDGEEALGRVVDLDVYNVMVSGRSKGSLNGKQNTGFAYKGVDVQPLPELNSLDVGGRGHLIWL